MCHQPWRCAAVPMPHPGRCAAALPVTLRCGSGRDAHVQHESTSKSTGRSSVGSLEHRKLGAPTQVAQLHVLRRLRRAEHLG